MKSNKNVAKIVVALITFVGLVIMGRVVVIGGNPVNITVLVLTIVSTISIVYSWRESEGRSIRSEKESYIEKQKRLKAEKDIEKITGWAISQDPFEQDGESLENLLSGIDANYKNSLPLMQKNIVNKIEQKLVELSGDQNSYVKMKDALNKIGLLDAQTTHLVELEKKVVAACIRIIEAAALSAYTNIARQGVTKAFEFMNEVGSHPLFKRMNIPQFLQECTAIEVLDRPKVELSDRKI
jgi:hypothetical protein